MKKTTNLQLPIYDNPSVDKFKLADWNTANQKIEDTFVDIGNKYNQALALSATNANLELVDARGGENDLGTAMRKKASKDDYKHIPRTEEELTQFLSEGKSVYINKDLGLTHTILINQNNVEVEFDKSVIINMSGKDFPAITIGSETNKPTYVRVKYPKLIGNKTTGSIGILVKGMGFNSEIFNPTIQGFQYGIKTSDFDCMQLNSIYEPLLTGNVIGLDDTNGGLQACRVYGGRIEQNSDYGVVIASPNVHFLGTVVEGNVKAEVKLLNKYATQYNSMFPSGGRFMSCYFEHIADNPLSEGSIFILGDNTQNNGWYGHLDLVGCDYYISGTEANKAGKTVIKSNGNALSTTESQKTINIFGGTFGVLQMFDLQNVGVDTIITANGVNMIVANSLPITTKVNTSARLVCGDKAGNYQYDSIRARYVCGGTVADTTVSPCSYIYTKSLRLEPSQSEKGNYIINTTSNTYPWLDSTTGINSGSLHYNSVTRKWYQRVITKSGADVQANWKELRINDDLQTTAVPTTTPERLYQHCYDYTNKKMYVAFGTASSSDWVAMN